MQILIIEDEKRLADALGQIMQEADIRQILFTMAGTGLPMLLPAITM